MEQTVWRTTPLYINTVGKHNGCNNENLTKVRCKFFKDRVAFVQDVVFCPICKKYFILSNEKSTLIRFRDYKLIDARTLEETSQANTSWKNQEEIKQKVVKKSPTNNWWQINHPLQGGGCDGK